jgi:hypothetical protein
MLVDLRLVKLRLGVPVGVLTRAEEDVFDAVAGHAVALARKGRRCPRRAQRARGPLPVWWERRPI